ncbi:MAG: hypothetical protein AB7O62_18405 [Pirellulales bacterium]
MMDQAARQNKRGGIAVIVLLVSVGLPILYVLSLGPAVWLSTHGYINDDILDWFYAPLDALYHRNRLAKGVLDFYVSFWE